jgi:hypothetical protein
VVEFRLSLFVVVEFILSNAAAVEAFSTALLLELFDCFRFFGVPLEEADDDDDEDDDDDDEADEGEELPREPTNRALMTATGASTLKCDGTVDSLPDFSGYRSEEKERSG